jgi:undecaprenyl phosphate N,N'-diacetylbacillosamine 1-phosphate transferase
MYRLCFKYVLDFVLALIIIIFLLPIFFIIWLLILFKLGGPVLFSQKRSGKNEKLFRIYKFRTMTDKKDEFGNLLPDDERITRLGGFLRKTSLDELPQLFNVLKGNLSLIGPRPLLVDYLPLYNDFQRRRHEVKPGITGWAQINGRNAITWDEKFKFDIWYIENQSFVLDMKIIFLTIRKVFNSEGINSDNTTTMERFNGKN